MHNYFYLSQSYLGNIYVMYIHLLGRHDVNLFHPQAFVSNKVFQVCPYFFFLGCFQTIWQLLFRLHPAVYTVQSCLYTQTGCFWSTSKFFSVNRSFEEDLSAFLVRVSGSAVSCEFTFLNARNLTCLQPLPNALYANYFSLKYRSFWYHRSFRSVLTQNQNKSRCILGAFIVFLSSPAFTASVRKCSH